MPKNFPSEKPLFAECGSCGHLHRADYWDDCRNDDERFTFAELDEHYGENGWLLDLATEGDSE